MFFYIFIIQWKHMNIWNIIKELTPYVVSIIASIMAYVQAKKKLTQELEIVKTNNEHEIKKIIEQHNINIKDLKEKHQFEMEAKDKEYQHEKEILELTSKNSIDEKNQEVISNLVEDIIKGKISMDQINKLVVESSDKTMKKD